MTQMPSYLAIKCVYFALALLVFGGSAHGATIKSSAGADLGGNGTFLLSDPSLQAFGLGAGYQASAFLNAWVDRPISAKMRFETVKFNESSLQKTKTDYLYPDSNLKSMTQQWMLLSFGAEGHFEGHGQILFWEALLGYAFGTGTSVGVSSSNVDFGSLNIAQTTNSGFCISGGVGIKRVFTPMVTGIMSLRSFFFLGPSYGSDPLASKGFIPFPLMFSVGAEFPFGVF